MRHDEAMDGILDWLGDLRAWQIVLLALGILVVLPTVSAIVTGLLVRRGLRTPWAIRKVNQLRDRAVQVVKRPITIMVLDEVADVIQSGRYTQNIAAALAENHNELAELVAEKVRRDPNLRVVGRLPGYHLIVTEVADTTLRVVVEMLGDPRMDELVADLLRNNLEQIRRAVRERDDEDVPPHVPPEMPRYQPRRKR
jgi:hypothetical protein